jgi:hypothetical protein
MSTRAIALSLVLTMGPAAGTGDYHRPTPVARIQAAFDDQGEAPIAPTRKYEDRVPTDDLRGGFDDSPGYIWWPSDGDLFRVTPATEAVPTPRPAHRPAARKRVTIRIAPASPIAVQPSTASSNGTRPRSAGLLCDLAPKLCD